jgi:ribonuclease VapC
MFLDASAIVAILAREPEAVSLMARLYNATGKLYSSPLATFEATLALAKAKTPGGARPTAETMTMAETAVKEFLAAIGSEDITISTKIGALAVEAGRTFGKVAGHPAALNFGDCFAYACAKAWRIPLLFKGNDFIQTDIVIA